MKGEIATIEQFMKVLAVEERLDDNDRSMLETIIVLEGPKIACTGEILLPATC